MPRVHRHEHGQASSTFALVAVTVGGVNVSNDAICVFVECFGVFQSAVAGAVKAARGVCEITHEFALGA